MSERRPLSTRASVLIGAAAIVAGALVPASAWFAHQRRARERDSPELEEFSYMASVEGPRWQRRHPGRQGSIFRYRDQIPGSVGEVSDFAALTVSNDPGIVRDGWGRPFRIRAPGPVHKHGRDLWSFGPNGINEQGGGDDILVGADVADVKSR